MISSNSTVSERNNPNNPPPHNTYNKIKILILEPDTKALNIICSVLKHQYELHRTTKVAEAIALLKNQNISILITDQALPNDNMRGYELLALVRQQFPDIIRILMVSSLDAINIKSYLKPDDAFKMLRKPIDQIKLSTAVTEAIERYLENAGAFSSIIQPLKTATTPAISHSKSEANTAIRKAYASESIIIKCKDEVLFEELKTSYKNTKDTLLLHASNRHDTIKYLEDHPTRSLVFAFEQKSENEDADTTFLLSIKQELPHLNIVGLVYKDTISYKELINLMKTKKITSYLPVPNKIERIRQQLDIAIAESLQFYPYITKLIWQPISQDQQHDELGANNLTNKLNKIAINITTKVKGRLEQLKNKLKRKH